MKCSIDYIIYKDENSRKVALSLSKTLNELGIPTEIFDCKESWGIDKQRALFIYSKMGRGSGVFTNQGLKNDEEFPYSIRLNKFSNKFLRSFINQIKSDYFINFYRNIREYGYPWGICEQKYLKKDLLYKFSQSKDGLIRSFAIFLKSLNPVISSETNLLESFKWISRGRNEELNVFILICPDYDCFVDSSGKYKI